MYYLLINYKHEFKRKRDVKPVTDNTRSRMMKNIT